jgi:hypothetical protein
MRRIRLLLPAAIAAAFTSGCSGSPQAPSEGAAGPLRLSAAITRPAIDPGTEATLTFTLENRGSENLVLTFPGGCTILTYIRSRDAVVYPGGGGWACPAIIAMLTLGPGESIASELRVRAAANAQSPVVPLTPGDYTAYATADSTMQHLTSDTVAFTVR